MHIYFQGGTMPNKPAAKLPEGKVFMLSFFASSFNYSKDGMRYVIKRFNRTQEMPIVPDWTVGKNGNRHGQYLLREDALRLWAFMKSEQVARAKHGLDCHR